MSDINSIKQSIDDHLTSVVNAYRRSFVKAIAEISQNNGSFSSINIRIDSDEFLSQQIDEFQDLSESDAMKLIAILAQEASE
jgi:hypothetical protein